MCIKKIFNLIRSKVMHLTHLWDQSYSWPQVYLCQFSASNRSWVRVKTDRQMDGETEIQDDRINHYCGILDKLANKINYRHIYTELGRTRNIKWKNEINRTRHILRTHYYFPPINKSNLSANITLIDYYWFNRLILLNRVLLISSACYFRSSSIKLFCTKFQSYNKCASRSRSTMLKA